MDITNLTALVSALKAETSKDSISPRYLGNILQAIVDSLENISAGSGGGVSAENAMAKATSALNLADKAQSEAEAASLSAAKANSTARDAADKAAKAADDAAAAVQQLADALLEIQAAKEIAGRAKEAAAEAGAKAEAAQGAADNAQEAADAARDTADNAYEGATARFSAFVQSSGSIGQQAPDSSEAVFDTTTMQFVAKAPDGSYYSNWDGDGAFFDGTMAVRRNKVYLCGDKAYLYSGSGSGLVEIGEKLYDKVKALGFKGSESDLYSALLLLPSTNAAAFQRLDFSEEKPINVTAAVSEGGTENSVVSGMYRVESRGASCGMLIASYHSGKQQGGSVGAVENAYIFSGYGELKGSQIVPSDTFHFIVNGRDCTDPSSLGNIFNVTEQVPVGGFYKLCDADDTAHSAVHAAFKAGKAKRGMVVTFEESDAVWRNCQFTGPDTAEDTFTSAANWKELSSGGGGSGSAHGGIININTLCGDADYTLPSAIAALLAQQESGGVQLAGEGLVITYRTGENRWETKQFGGIVANFSETGLWNDFGGGDKVAVSPTPEKGGTAALSTGGAYELVPSALSMTYEENVLKASLRNASGEVIGEEQQFVISGGGGGGEGTIIAIIPERSPFYAKAGGSVVMHAAVRSVTTQGGSDLLNTIEKVELYDRDTNQLLETFRFNKPSSADAATFDFEFDLSGYFPLASQRKFKLTAYDDGDHSGSRNINVTAVDVTIHSEQTLNYTASTVLQQGGQAKSLPMYRFPNNASDKGIRCTVEAFDGGEWKKLGEAVHTDTYAHSVGINPSDCLGKALTHGALQLRIHGEDIASGVVGNYLYTSVMVVGGGSTPIVATRRYSDTADATVKLYDSISLDFAVYDPSDSVALAEVVERRTGGSAQVRQSVKAARSKTYTFTEKVADTATDGSVAIEIYVRCGAAQSAAASTTVTGSLLDIEPVKSQLMLDIDFSGRNNADADKSITYGAYTLAVSGANYSTNGFVKDSFGTSAYDPKKDDNPGITALRIAENVTASLDYKPFSQQAIETNGCAVQFRIRTRNIADEQARLMSCMGESGIGFYVTGKSVVFTADGGQTVAHTVDAALNEDALTDVAIVIEPVSKSPYSGIGVVKVYFDGEPVGACYYDAGKLLSHDTPVTFDGTNADLYLYNIRAWATYYTFEQSFNNYLLKIADTDAMIKEYKFNQVMASQAAEGTAATNRPQASALYSQGMPYFVLCKNNGTGGTDDQFPEYLESLDGDKKTKRVLDVYAYFPDRPWQDFKAVGAVVTNQGTTSSKRPIKNVKMKFKTAAVTLLRSRSEFESDPGKLAKYDRCAANAAKHKVTVYDDSLPTNIITVKVDYSESGGANNGASTQLFNELQLALGDSYITPAQRFNQDSHTINTSINSIPCAFFRTDRYSSDATSPSYGYFHAKGNWNEDKGDAKVFGFEGVNGYNAGCLNYGDFHEIVADRGETLDSLLARSDKEAWKLFEKEKTEVDGGTVVTYWETIVLSEFCGPAHRVFRLKDGGWQETTGTMEFADGKWKVTGDVVNPVENYELLKYDKLDWFMGVNTVDDMLAPDTDGNPIWLQYYESRYPDDDSLNAIYEAGKKVPYNLYRWLRFCTDCSQLLSDSKEENSAKDSAGNEKIFNGAGASTTIRLGGSEVPGTKANRLKKWRQELHTVANVFSMLCYHIFTDYIAAVDQRSKNMMVGFYLDTDGVVRMYLNHLYDGDTILGSDNDCGLTVPVMLDPNTDNKYYQGHGSVLFTQIKNTGTDPFWLDAEGKAAVTTRQVAEAMRKQTDKSGLVPFSPGGLTKYWITDRLSKWPKLVSAYDGIRKYIEHSKSTANYFYALHGLGVQRLKNYIAERFLFRDGFYQTGDLYSSSFDMRMSAAQDVTFKVKAAKAGFIGVGVERVDAITDSKFMEAGEEYTLVTHSHILGAGNQMYIFGADRLAEVDISCGTVTSSGWNIGELKLLRKFIIGGAAHKPSEITGGALQTLSLGSMPFLEELDIRNTAITSVNAEYCPRLVSLHAAGSALSSLTLAETSPISSLDIPATMSSLSFVNLPNLGYPGGLTFESPKSVAEVRVSGCPGIDSAALLHALVGAGAQIKKISLPDVSVSGNTDILRSLKASGAVGFESELNDACDGISGVWTLTDLVDDAELEELQAYFPKLEIINSQYTTIVIDDTSDDPKNVTNLSNGTSGEGYRPSGHILKIRKSLVPLTGALDTASGKWKGRRMSGESYHKLSGGAEFDYTDRGGSGNDAMMLFPGTIWYKGINDYKVQKKYIVWSSSSARPRSSAKKTVTKGLWELSKYDNKAVITGDIVAGVDTIDSAGVMVTANSCTSFKFNVEGMKQVRWPGINSTSYGAVFIDGSGLILSKFQLSINSAMLDMENGDYLFTDVPDGAKFFIFTTINYNEGWKVIAVDSADVEAVEPDWVQNSPFLLGIYQASVDSITQLRSVSGATVKSGDNSGSTSAEWSYNSAGDPLNTPSTKMSFTCKDFQNLSRRRGAGYQMADYEMWKLVAMLALSISGSRDFQLVYGYGMGSADYTTGYSDSFGNADVPRLSIASGNKLLGIEALFGHDNEWVDYLVINAPSWTTAYKERMVVNSANAITDLWRIYNPADGTERTVKGIGGMGWGDCYCIARVRHGRHCDIVPTKLTNDNSTFAKNWCDGIRYTSSSTRMALRGGMKNEAGNGMLYADIRYSAAQNGYGNTTRLAFRGEVEIED